MNRLSQTVLKSPQAMSIKYNTIVYELQRMGKKITVLSLGEAFFDIPLFPMSDLPFPNIYHYSHSRGIPELRKRLAEFFLQHYDFPVNYEKEILITAGSKAAIHFAFMSTLNPGDEVIIPEPAWVSYVEQVKLCYGVPVQVPYYKTIYDWQNYITDKTKGIIINNPQNPSGYNYSMNELTHLLDVAKRNNLWVYSDEAYSEFTPEGKFTSLGKLDRNKEHTIVFNSLSKNYGISGWRLGYVIANENLITNLLKVNQHIITCPSTILEHYLVKHFDDILEHTNPQIRNLLKRRNEICTYLDELGLKYLQGDSTFYLFLSISPSQLNSEEFATKLLVEDQISTVPGIGYGLSCDKFIRISIGTESMDTMKKALLKIKERIYDTSITKTVKPKNALVVAGGKWQVPIIQFLQMNDYTVHVVDPYLYSDGVQISDKHIIADVRDVDEIERQIQNINFDFITTDQSDIAVNTVSILSEKLNLSSNPHQVTLLFTNKYFMRKYAQKTGVPCPEFERIYSISELNEFIEKVKLPVIIKPADSQSSRGIAVISKKNLDDLNEYFTEALRYTSCGYIIAEKHIMGTEVTAEGFCSGGKHRTLAMSSKTHFRPGIASSLLYPADIKEDIYAAIQGINDKFVESSGMLFGITHAEYMIDANGNIFLIEIAARGGGTLISSNIIKWTSGVDVYQLLLQCLLGKSPAIESIALDKKAALLQFFEFSSGRVEKIVGVEAAQELEHVYKIEMGFKEGDILNNAKDDRTRHGYAIILADTVDQIKATINKVNDMISVITYDSSNI